MEAINYAANYAGRIFNIETLGKAIAYSFFVMKATVYQ